MVTVDIGSMSSASTGYAQLTNIAVPTGFRLRVEPKATVLSTPFAAR